MNSGFRADRDVTGLGVMLAVREHPGWFIGLGIAMLVLGALAIATPLVASLVTTLFMGWLLIIGGVVHGVHAFQNRRWAGFPWALLSAILYVIAGGLILANPVAGTLTLTLILAAFFLANGFVKVVRALEHRAMPNWGFLLFDGLITLVLGVLIWARWPSTAVWAIGLLVGVEMIFGGLSMLMLGMLGRSSTVRTHV
jgi:uncharacterized membrane protein HdeD (DUF308 family)